SRDSDMVRVAVTDNGPGVPEEFYPHVFEPFAQATPSLEDSRNKDSAGLGLSIVKAIVEKLGGRIGFDSTPGVATIFYVLLPEWRGDPRS
ncbi:MAG: ATP-binding protein, partial [Gammaproteobacteria bacterium]|nr:ATP-binding protein [Gammaproteobacteria bacterium]